MLTKAQEIDSIYEDMNGYGMFPTKHPKTYLKKAYVAGIKAGEAKERERCANILRGVNNFDNPMTANDCLDVILKEQK